MFGVGRRISDSVKVVRIWTQNRFVPRVECRSTSVSLTVYPKNRGNAAAIFYLIDVWFPPVAAARKHLRFPEQAAQN